MNDSLVQYDPLLVGGERSAVERALVRDEARRSSRASGQWLPFAVPDGYEVWQAGYEVGIGRCGCKADPRRPGALPDGVGRVGTSSQWRVPGCAPGLGVRGTSRVAIGPVTLRKRRGRIANPSATSFGFQDRDDADAINEYVLNVETKANFGAYPNVLDKLRPLFAEWKKKYTEAIASLYVSDADLAGMKETRDKINALIFKPYVDADTGEKVDYNLFKARSADATTSNVQLAAAATRNQAKAAISPWTIAAIAVAGVGVTGGAAFLFLLPKPVWAAYSLAGGLTGGAAIYGVGKAIEGSKAAASAALAVVK